MKKKTISNKGITLIALVITIIILLILAGISIAMLTGENGILTRTNEAKEKTQKENIIEEARIKIVEKQTENFGTLTEQELTEILTLTYGTLSGNGETILDKNLTTKEGNYEIPVKEIYNGILTRGKIHFKIPDGHISSDGTQGYVEYTFEYGVTWYDIYEEVFTIYRELWGNQFNSNYHAGEDGVYIPMNFDADQYITLEGKRVKGSDLVQNDVIYKLLP